MANLEKIDILRHISRMYFTSSLVADLMSYSTGKGVDRKRLARYSPKKKYPKYVDYEAITDLLNLIIDLLNDEQLGLHVAEHGTLNATAPVDNIMLNSQTLEDSLNNAIEYSKVISDAMECSLQVTESTFSITYDENPNWQVYPELIRKQVMDMALLSNVKSLAAYTNYRYYPIRIHFTYQKPKKINEYYRLFNCSLRFNQLRNEIFFDRHILGKHEKEVQLGLLEGLKNKVAEEINQLQPEAPLVNELKKLVLNKVPKRMTVTAAADLLNTSSRTLQRNLTSLNTSFKAIETEMLLKLATTYLNEQEKSVEEIAYLLGFSESSTFIRFFKSMTGQTPKTYQKAC